MAAKYLTSDIMSVITLYKKGVSKEEIKTQTNIPYGTFAKWLAWYRYAHGLTVRKPVTYPKSVRGRRELNELFGVGEQPVQKELPLRERAISEALQAVSNTPITDVTLARKCSDLLKLKSEYEKAKRELATYLGGV